MSHAENGGNNGLHRGGVYVFVGSLIAMAVLGWLAKSSGATSWTVAFQMSQVVVISVVIWQACDPFADAAQWVGTTLRLPGSVRGATLDAIASSMPELFSGIFFVVLAVTTAQETAQSVAHAGGEGFSATVATCAGSAVYNMILIPAFCALVISVRRPSRPTIDVESKVISRDGLWFLGCEIILIAFLSLPAMHWWMSVIFMALYAVYILQLWGDARSYQRAHDAIADHLDRAAGDVSVAQLDEMLRGDGIKVPRALIDQIRTAHRAAADEDDEEPLPATAGILFGYAEIPLSHLTAWGVIAVCTLIAAVACYWLVAVTRSTAEQLDVPVFFVAVIVAAAASSVPDTFLSIAAARHGDDSGAVSNAFGSNVFDICICLSIPLLVSAYLNGWQPVALLEDGKPLPGLVGIRVLLCVLTVVTLLIMWHRHQLTRAKALVLCGLYALFVAYAVAGSLGIRILGYDL